MFRSALALLTVSVLVGCTTSTPTVSATIDSAVSSACPVTQPAAPDAVPAAVAAFMVGGMILPTGMTPPPLRTMYGNDALWVDLGTSDGTLPGVAETGGGLGAKFPTYRLVDGNVAVSARRLDGPSAAVSSTADPAGYGTSGFLPVGVDFPSTGCWSVTETVAGRDLVFVIRVVPG
jgi:hypothetical protein